MVQWVGIGTHILIFSLVSFYFFILVVFIPTSKFLIIFILVSLQPFALIFVWPLHTLLHFIHYILEPAVSFG